MVFTSRCSVRVPNDGDSSGLVVTLLPPGDHLRTHNSQVTHSVSRLNFYGSSPAQLFLTSGLLEIYDHILIGLSRARARACVERGLVS
jgi:hypothetical protein